MCSIFFGLICKPQICLKERKKEKKRTKKIDTRALGKPHYNPFYRSMVDNKRLNKQTKTTKIYLFYRSTAENVFHNPVTITPQLTVFLGKPKASVKTDLEIREAFNKDAACNKSKFD